MPVIAREQLTDAVLTVGSGFGGFRARWCSPGPRGVRHDRGGGDGAGHHGPTGLGARDYWEATLAGKNGIGRITRFDPSRYPARLAGEIPGFAAEEHLPSRLLPQTDRMTRLALVAADWALEDAGIRPQELPESSMGVVTASSSGGFEFGQGELRALWSQGSQYVSAYQSFAWFYAVNSGQISIRHGMKGPSSVVVSDQAGGLDAIAQARRLIRKGTAVVVSGAVDASVCPWGWVAQLAAQPDHARRAQPGVPALRPGGGRIRAGRGRRAPRHGVRGVGTRAWRARLQRDRRVRRDVRPRAGQRAPAGPAPGDRTRPGRRRDAGRAGGRRVLRRGGRPRARPHRGGGDHGGVRAEGRSGHRAEDDDGPPLLGRGTSGPGHRVPVPARRSDPADGARDAGPDYELDLVVGRPRAAAPRTALVLARGHGGFNSAAVVRAIA